GDRLEDHRPAVLGGERGRLAGCGDAGPGRAGRADGGQPLAHDHLVLGVDEGVGAGVDGVALLDEGPDVLAGDVLVVEGDRVAALGEVAQVVEGTVVADPGVDDDPGGALVGGAGEQAQLDPEGDGGGLGHPGELSGADDADDGADGAVSVHVW